MPDLLTAVLWSQALGLAHSWYSPHSGNQRRLKCSTRPDWGTISIHHNLQLPKNNPAPTAIHSFIWRTQSPRSRGSALVIFNTNALVSDCEGGFGGVHLEDEITVWLTHTLFIQSSGVNYAGLRAINTHYNGEGVFTHFIRECDRQQYSPHLTVNSRQSLPWHYHN